MYSFYHNEKVELSIGAGLHLTAIDAGIHGEASKNGEPVAFTQEGRCSSMASLRNA